VRVRESGYYKGKRKLTRQGNPEIRRLSFNAARAASRTKTWNDYYLSMRARGHSTTSRKLGEKSCVIKQLTQLVKNYDGNIIVAGDFNLSDNTKEYRNFLSQTNLSDEGIKVGVDQIAYRGCRLISADREPLVNLSDHRLLHATFNCN